VSVASTPSVSSVEHQPASTRGGWLGSDRRGGLSILIGLGIYGLAVVLRLWGLTQSVTADDQDWVGRVVDFAGAIEHRAFRDTYRSALGDRKRKVQRVPLNNGADWLAFRKDSGIHKSFENLYVRQQVSRITSLETIRRCQMCDTSLGDRRSDAETCSAPCRKRAQRRREESEGFDEHHALPPLWPAHRQRPPLPASPDPVRPEADLPGTHPPGAGAHLSAPWQVAHDPR
jgi:hypothetical protein